LAPLAASSIGEHLDVRLPAEPLAQVLGKVGIEARDDEQMVWHA